MAKVICLFNHKGGVSKTTTAFNLGWMLGNMGHKVLLADFDPQCNLTGMVFGYQGIEDLEEIYCSSPANNIKDALAPAFESRPKQITGAECFDVSGNDNVKLLAGHVGLAEYETTLGVAQELSGSLLALRNLPGSIRFLLDETAAKHNIEYIIADMSPSLGPLNQNILTTSDHFIVPLHPDYFSSMALSSLSKSLPRWAAWAKTANNIPALKDADYPFPELKTKFIGAVVQKYRVRNGLPASAFRKWLDTLVDVLETQFIPSLAECGLLDTNDFETRSGQRPSEPILSVGDFNSLIAYSHQFRVPIYALTQAMLADQAGAVWEQTRENMERFEVAFRSFAEKVVRLTA